jgi:hypothetical protein
MFKCNWNFTYQFRIFRLIIFIIIIIILFFFVQGFSAIAYYDKNDDAGSWFFLSSVCTAVAALMYLAGGKIPIVAQTKVGWHATRNYCRLITCCNGCRWSLDSTLGQCMNNHCHCCAPGESSDHIAVAEEAQCFLIHCCCRCLPTQYFDETCSQDTTCDKFLFFMGTFFAIVFSLAGWIQLYLTVNGVGAQSVYLFKQWGISQAVAIALEIVWLFVSLFLDAGTRVCAGCCVDMGVDIGQMDEPTVEEITETDLVEMRPERTGSVSLPVSFSSSSSAGQALTWTGPKDQT